MEIITFLLFLLGVGYWVATFFPGKTLHDKRKADKRAKEGTLNKELQRAQERVKECVVERGLTKGLSARSEKPNPGTAKTHPFESIPLHKRKWLSQQWKFHNALTELNNALAASISVRQVTLDVIEDINSRYRLDLHNIATNQMEVMYEEFLAFCLADRKFTDDEIADLRHLQSLFGLSDSKQNILLAKVGAAVYRKAISEVLSDNRLSPEERIWLDHLANDLELSEQTKLRVYNSEAAAFLNSRVKTVLSDSMLSPEEEKEIEAIAHQLGVASPLKGATSATLEKYRIAWRFAHGDPPVLSVDVNLGRKEECYFVTDVHMHEMKRRVKRIQYSGPRMKIKIFKNLYWRMGDVAVRTVSRDELVKIDEGQMFLTNKRILFLGTVRNRTFPVSKIVDFEIFKDGVMIDRDSGNKLFFEFSSNVDLLGAALARVIRDIA